MGTRCADHVTLLYPQKLALTSPTGGGRSVGIVHVQTKATEFVFCLYWSIRLGASLPEDGRTAGLINAVFFKILNDGPSPPPPKKKDYGKIFYFMNAIINNIPHDCVWK